MRLYRIISLETFIDILHNKRERYVRPATWKDTFEGYLYSKIYDKNERRKIVEDIYYNVSAKNCKATIDTMLRLEHSKWFVYGQCWSKKAESDAMWRIYSYEKHSVQIRTTETRILNMLKNVGGIKYGVKPIKYDVNPADDLMHIQVRQLKDNLNIYEPFLHKRKAFKHEAEQRVLIDDMRWFEMTELSSLGANWDIDKAVQNLADDNEVIDEIINRLEQYLDKWNTKK